MFKVNFPTMVCILISSHFFVTFPQHLFLSFNFVTLSHMSSLCVLGINLLLGISLANIFSLSVRYLFVLVRVSFAIQNHLTFNYGYV